MIVESLTARPGIREQYRSKADLGLNRGKVCSCLSSGHCKRTSDVMEELANGLAQMQH
jgi:hypothetical protein